MSLLNTYVLFSPITVLAIVVITFMFGSISSGLAMEELQWEDGITDPRGAQSWVAVYAYTGGLCNIAITFWVVIHYSLYSGLVFGLLGFPSLVFLGYAIISLIGSQEDGG